MKCDRHIGPYPCCSIITGDSKVLAKDIPDDSIDLIFTDPVYDQIDDYRWLAETAVRVLKPDSACLTWCSNVKQYKVKAEMERWLDFVLPLQYVVVGKTYRLFYYHTFIWTTPCLWLQKGRALPSRWVADTFISTRPTSKDNPHRWNKNLGVHLNWLEAFCPPDGLVVDFFCGGGTIPVTCKTVGRHYLAFEIDPTMAELARERVANAQPPLFVLGEPEQFEMF